MNTFTGGIVLGKTLSQKGTAKNFVDPFKCYLTCRKHLWNFTPGEFLGRAAIWGGGVIFATPPYAFGPLKCV